MKTCLNQITEEKAVHSTRSQARQGGTRLPLLPPLVVAHACCPYRIVLSRCVVVDDDYFTLGDWARVFGATGISSRVVIDSFTTAARAGRAVVVRHLVCLGGGGDELWFRVSWMGVVVGVTVTRLCLSGWVYDGESGFVS